MSEDVNTDVSVAGLWYDGITTRQRAASLRVVDGRLCVDDVQSATLADVRVQDRLGDTPRVIEFAAGARFVSDDHAGLAALLIELRGPHMSLIERLEQSWRWGISALVAIALISYLMVFQVLPAVSETIAMRLPLSWQQQLGRETLRVLDLGLLESSQLDAERQRELQQAYATLLQGNEWQQRSSLFFRRLPGNQANAFALPDGSIVMTDGLVAAAQHDHEILAVLAHELGHLQRRHALRNLIQSSGVAAIALAIFGDTSGITAAVAGLPTVLLQARYTRTFEQEADHYAAHLLKQRNIARDRFTDVLQRIADDADAAEVPDLLRSHPLTSERIASYRKIWEGERDTGK